ncbi:MAG TPA: hypothetical protein VF788_08630, partial [Pseudonocardiaceae bacterium]
FVTSRLFRADRPWCPASFKREHWQPAWWLQGSCSVMVDAGAHPRLGHHDVALPAPAHSQQPRTTGQAPPGKYVLLGAD